jgi:hypothetical protein
MKKEIKKATKKVIKDLPKMESYLSKEFLFKKHSELVVGLKREKFSEKEIHKILNDIN